MSIEIIWVYFEPSIFSKYLTFEFTGLRGFSRRSGAMIVGLHGLDTLPTIGPKHHVYLARRPGRRAKQAIVLLRLPVEDTNE